MRMRAAVVMRVPFGENDVQPGLGGIAHENRRSGATVGGLDPLDLVGECVLQRRGIEIGFRSFRRSEGVRPLSSPARPAQNLAAFWNET